MRAKFTLEPGALGDHVVLSPNAELSIHPGAPVRDARGDVIGTTLSVTETDDGWTVEVELFDDAER